jgi:hypothetical protein
MKFLSLVEVLLGRVDLLGAVFALVGVFFLAAVFFLEAAFFLVAVFFLEAVFFLALCFKTHLPVSGLNSWSAEHFLWFLIHGKSFSYTRLWLVSNFERDLVTFPFAFTVRIFFMSFDQTYLLVLGFTAPLLLLRIISDTKLLPAAAPLIEFVPACSFSQRQYDVNAVGLFEPLLLFLGLFLCMRANIALVDAD